MKPENVVNGFRACGLCPFDENAIDYSKCLAPKKPDEAADVGNKLMSLKDFESIVGPEMIKKLKIVHTQRATLVNSPTLYKIWSFFQSDFPHNESTNIEIQTANNTTTNVNLTSEDNVTTVKITMTPTKSPTDLCPPSTSKYIPRLSNSINDYLQSASDNKRKFI